jgi:acyl-CoA reductase-like NAD-dependent aldehyde dehydrogenase
MEIEVKNYIDGEFVRTTNTYVNKNIVGDPAGPSLRMSCAGPWDLNAAIETCSRVQPKFQKFDLHLLIEILKKSMDFYFVNPEEFVILAQMTGSPLNFVKCAINETKEWVRNFDKFMVNVFGNLDKLHFSSPGPTLAILPSNSEQEALYVIAQTILARSTILIRPSSRGASSYSSVKFVEAWNMAVDYVAKEHSEMLHRVINIVNVPDMGGNWELLAIDGWNYVFFGSTDTVQEIEKTIESYANPRNIIGFGAVLSATIIDESVIEEFSDLQELSKNCLESISCNRGDECVATDVFYMNAKMCGHLYPHFDKLIKDYQSGHSLQEGTIGLVSDVNALSIKELFQHFGKHEHLNFSESPTGKILIHTSMVPLSKHDLVQEFPGPIAGIRVFSSRHELLEMMEFDLKRRTEGKFLTCSIYGNDQFFDEIAPQIKAHSLKHNKVSHIVDLHLPHQGMHLLRELSDITVIERRSKDVSEKENRK